MDRAAEDGWTRERVKVDAIYGGPRIAAAGERHGLDFQVSTQDPAVKGVTPLPLRWRLEATLGTLTNRDRRLTRTLEQNHTTAEDAVMVANGHRVLRAYQRNVPEPS